MTAPRPLDAGLSLQPLREAFAYRLKPGAASEATPEELAKFAQLTHEAMKGAPELNIFARERRGIFHELAELARHAGGRGFAGGEGTLLDGSRTRLLSVKTGSTVELLASNKSTAKLHVAFVRLSPDHGNELIDTPVVLPLSSVGTRLPAPAAGDGHWYAFATFRQPVPALLLSLPLEDWPDFGLANLVVFRIESG